MVSNVDYDVIVIGGGPAGMMAASVASIGNILPHSKNDEMDVLILEKHNFGGMANNNNNLFFSRNWVVSQDLFINKIKLDLSSPYINIHEKETVTSVNLGKDKKIISTDKNKYSASAIIIATGTFPFPHLIKNKGITCIMFPDEVQDRTLRALGHLNHNKRKILLVMSKFSDYRLKQVRLYLPDANIISLVEGPDVKGGINGKLIDVFKRADSNIAVIESQDKQKHLKVDHIIIDYNSYKHFTTTTSIFPFSIKSKNGKIIINENFETSIKGVFACGNVATKISGSLTAVSSAFVAGMNTYSYIHKKKYKENPDLFPWIPQNEVNKSYRVDKPAKLKIGKKCNNNCLICSALDIKGEYDKSTNQILKELNLLKEKKYTEVIFPCNSDMRKDLLKILKFAKNLGFKITLETNGRMFCYKDFNNEVKKYVDKVVFFIFGNDSYTHDSITHVKGSYDELIKGKGNIKNLGIFTEFKELNFLKSKKNCMFKKPNEVSIELTSKCNFNCHNCFNKASFAKKGRKQKGMSTDYVKEVINSIAESEITRIRFSGGEPLSRDDIFDLMEYAKSKGLKIWLNTNGSIINEEIVNKLEKYVENVLVSFNGYDDKSDFRWTNTRNSFRDKLKGVKLLKKSEIPMIRASTVATPENIDNLEKIYETVKENNLDEWIILRPIPLKKENSDFDIGKLFNKILRLSMDFGRPISITNAIPFCCFDPKKMESICIGARADDGHSRIVVDPKGFAKPSYFINKNIGDPRNIMECWNNNFMKQMRSLQLMPNKCKQCLYVERCKGGSRYIANLYNGSYSSWDPLAISKNIIKV